MPLHGGQPHSNQIFKMKKIVFLMLAAVLVASCSSGNEDDPAKDMEKPDFTDGELPSPLDCEVYHKGETIAFRYIFTDNRELGSFNIEIHNNRG